jgi:hypothetical protein
VLLLWRPKKRLTSRKNLSPEGGDRKIIESVGRLNVRSVSLPTGRVFRAVSMFFVPRSTMRLLPVQRCRSRFPTSIGSVAQGRRRRENRFFFFFFFFFFFLHVLRFPPPPALFFREVSRFRIVCAQRTVTRIDRYRFGVYPSFGSAVMIFRKP